MHRRDLLRLLGGLSALAGLSPDELLALGPATHARLRDETSPLGFFDNHQMRTVVAAAERILPRTDTPGATEAGCARFLERIVADHYDAPRQQRFLAGLVDLDQRASARTQHLFVDALSVDQDAVLTDVESAAYAAKADGAESFWRDLKHLTLYGYYTSEVGITQELKTPRIPGRFDGAMPIAGGR